jgi:hypothetical protein
VLRNTNESNYGPKKFYNVERCGWLRSYCKSIQNRVWSNLIFTWKLLFYTEILSHSFPWQYNTKNLFELGHKLKQAGQNLGRVFNSRSDCMRAMSLFFFLTWTAYLKVENLSKTTFVFFYPIDSRPPQFESTAKSWLLITSSLPIKQANHLMFVQTPPAISILNHWQPTHSASKIGIQWWIKNWLSIFDSKWTVSTL